MVFVKSVRENKKTKNNMAVDVLLGLQWGDEGKGGLDRPMCGEL